MYTHASAIGVHFISLHPLISLRLSATHISLCTNVLGFFRRNLCLAVRMKTVYTSDRCFDTSTLFIGFPAREEKNISVIFNITEISLKIHLTFIN